MAKLRNIIKSSQAREIVRPAIRWCSKRRKCLLVLARETKLETLIVIVVVIVTVITITIIAAETVAATTTVKLEEGSVTFSMRCCLELMIRTIKLAENGRLR